MIQYLTRNQLDEKKYDNCISNAINTRIYAYSWYLDRACDDWDVLIKNDYQYVMPLPKRKKYGFHYIYQAPWIQQLGIFSKSNIDESLILQFINSIPRKYILIDVFFNSMNIVKSRGVKLRDNYILELKEPYEVLRKQFSKGRKSSIKQAKNCNLTIIENYNHNEIIELFRKNKGKEIGGKGLEYDVLNKLIDHAVHLNFAKSYTIINDLEKPIGGALFLIDTNRITYLFSAINKEGRTKHAMSFLLNTIIKNNSESNLILDFEGSMIKEIASFFKSFGAKKETYYHLKKYNI